MKLVSLPTIALCAITIVCSSHTQEPTTGLNLNDKKSSHTVQARLEQIDTAATTAYRVYNFGSKLYSIGSYCFTRWAPLATDTIPATALAIVTQIKGNAHAVIWKQLPSNSIDIVRYSAGTLAINLEKFAELTPDEQQLAVARKIIRSSKNRFIVDGITNIILSMAVSYGLNCYNYYSTKAFDAFIDSLASTPDNVSYKILTTLKSTNSVIARSALTKALVTYCIKSKISQSRDASAKAAAIALLASNCATA